MHSYFIKIRTYSLNMFLKRIKEEKIKIYNLILFNEYEYSFYTSFFSYLKIKKLKYEFYIVKINGIPSFFTFLFSRKTVIFSLILSFLSFFYLNTLIFKIEVNGVSSSLNSQIKEYVSKEGLKEYLPKKSKERIHDIERETYFKFREEISLLSIVLEGNHILINYNKRPPVTKNESLHPSMFASSSGIIAFINISKGDVLVKVNDYVNEGDMLVNEFVNNVRVGTRGKIFAYTYLQIKVSKPYISKEEDFIYLQNEARYMVLKKLTLEGRIDNEVLLSLNVENKKIYASFHYTLYENIISF